MKEEFTATITWNGEGATFLLKGSVVYLTFSNDVPLGVVMETLREQQKLEEIESE